MPVSLSRWLSGILITIVASFCAVTSYAESGVAGEALKTSVDQIVTQFIENNNIAGAAIAIHYQGKDYLFTYGFADKEKKKKVTVDTIFDLASISKVMTTTLLAIAVDKNEIKLNDPIIKYLPDLATSKNLPIDKIKVEELATHTASLPRDMTGFGLQRNDGAKLMPALKTWRPARQPGSHYLYSNLSFGLLGVVLENAVDLPYTSQLSKRLLQPLRMTHTGINLTLQLQVEQAVGYRPNGDPVTMTLPAYLYGAGAVRSSIKDMLMFLDANLNSGQIEKLPELQKAIQLTHQPFFKVNPNFVLGLGWQRVTRQGELYITKNGANSGFASFIGFSPSKQLGVVVLLNKGKGRASILGNKILDAMRE